MNDRYILDAQGTPVPEPDLMKWACWYESATRIVAQEWVGEAQVSTVFLGLDHNHRRQGPPILWETMVFNGRLNGSMARCAGSKEQAEAMHQSMVDKVKSEL
jgi:hypothetical protein